jgi:hypothetical protein
MGDFNNSCSEGRATVLRYMDHEMQGPHIHRQDLSISQLLDSPEPLRVICIDSDCNGGPRGPTTAGADIPGRQQVVVSEDFADGLLPCSQLLLPIHRLHVAALQLYCEATHAVAYTSWLWLS